MYPIDIHSLLKNKHINKHIASLQDPKPFIDCLNDVTQTGNISLLARGFPETLSKDEFYKSLLLNLKIDYDQIITDIPEEFLVKKSESRTHVGNSNQMELIFKDHISKKDFISKGIDSSYCKIASTSFYFLNTNNKQELFLEDIQGDIKEGSGYYSVREIKRVFGKLNTFYGIDWKLGVLQQIYDFGIKNKMHVKGKIPGMFYFFDSSMTDYPLYTLNYLSTYLQIGIKLEDIAIKKVKDKYINSQWEKTISFLESKEDIDKIRTVKEAANEYRKEFTKNMRGWLFERKISMDTYKKNCKSAYKRIFSEMLSF